MIEAITERLARCYTAVVHDVMRGMGERDFVLPPRLRPIVPDRVLAGPAFTIEGRIDRRPARTTRCWPGRGCPRPLRRDMSGSAQPNGDTVAHMGELSAETLADHGVRGGDGRHGARCRLPAGTGVPDLVHGIHAA